jgi:hypothetical protein
LTALYHKKTPKTKVFFIVLVFEGVEGVYGARWADTVGFKATTQNGLIWITGREKPRRGRLKRHITDIGFRKYSNVKLFTFIKIACILLESEV